MREKMPFIKHPEVSKSTAASEGRAIEELVYDYKITREEMLSIFDEVREYLPDTRYDQFIELIKKPENFIEILREAIEQYEMKKVHAMHDSDTTDDSTDKKTFLMRWREEPLVKRSDYQNWYFINLIFCKKNLLRLALMKCKRLMHILFHKLLRCVNP